jgi:hypothetical protein
MKTPAMEIGGGLIFPSDWATLTCQILSYKKSLKAQATSPKAL